MNSKSFIQNGKSDKPVLLPLIALIFLLVPGLTCKNSVAGSDCGNPTSSVDTLICANVTILRLDKQLTQTLEAAFAKANDPVAVNTAQNAWLQARNACLDAACLEALYRTRISDLQWIVYPPSLPRFPPYPEIWDWQPPKGFRVVDPWLTAHLLDNGDVLIVFSAVAEHGHARDSHPGQRPSAALDRKMTGLVSKAMGMADRSEQSISGQITLFGGQTVVHQSSNIRLLREQSQPLLLSDGTWVRILKSDKFEQRPTDKRLTDGSRVHSSGFRLHDCFVGPARDRFFRDMPGVWNDLASKVIFYLLDRPKIWKGAYYELCDEDEHRLVQRVEAMQGSVLPLPDGTFLIIDDDHGLILRFDKDFQTKTPLLNQKVFVFDQSLVARYDYDVEKLTGKEYLNNQEALNDLYHYVLGIKRGHRT